MGSTRNESSIESWESALIAGIAKAFRTTDPDDLRAELAHQLIRLKRTRATGIRDWRAYIARALRNRAVDFVRAERTTQERITPFGGNLLDPAEPSEGMPPSFAPMDDLRLAFTQAWETLTPELRRVWLALHEEDGRREPAAVRLGIHRNTIRERIRAIGDVLTAHGFEVRFSSERRKRPSGLQKPARRRPCSIRLSLEFLRRLCQLPLRGTQWRILFWVISETHRRKHVDISCNWQRVAKSLVLDRGGVSRAGRDLIRVGILIARQKRIRPCKHPNQWRFP